KIDFINKSGGEIIVDYEQEILEINTDNIQGLILNSYDFPIRTTYLLVAGLIKKCGIARIPYPGGCKIGSRGYDLHIMIWNKLGCTVEEKEDYIIVKAEN